MFRAKLLVVNPEAFWNLLVPSRSHAPAWGCRWMSTKPPKSLVACAVRTYSLDVNGG